MSKQIFLLSTGTIRHYVAADDRDDAYEQGTNGEKFPDICYLPFDIHEVTVPGYTISLHPEKDEDDKPKRGRKSNTDDK